MTPRFPRGEGLRQIWLSRSFGISFLTEKYFAFSLTTIALCSKSTREARRPEGSTRQCAPAYFLVSRRMSFIAPCMVTQMDTRPTHLSLTT
jgi:hypothetical protein